MEQQGTKPLHVLSDKQRDSPSSETIYPPIAVQRERAMRWKYDKLRIPQKEERKPLEQQRRNALEYAKKQFPQLFLQAENVSQESAEDIDDEAAHDDEDEEINGFNTLEDDDELEVEGLSDSMSRKLHPRDEVVAKQRIDTRCCDTPTTKITTVACRKAFPAVEIATATLKYAGGERCDYEVTLKVKSLNGQLRNHFKVYN
jgi:hypothetical protein